MQEVLLSQLLADLPEDEALDKLFHQPPGLRGRLSRRSLLILRRRLDGCTFAQIGAELNLSASYARQQISQIRRKLQALNVTLDVLALFPAAPTPSGTQAVRTCVLTGMRNALSQLLPELAILTRLQVRGLEPQELMAALPCTSTIAGIVRLLHFDCVSTDFGFLYEITPVGLEYLQQLQSFFEENGYLPPRLSDKSSDCDP